MYKFLVYVVAIAMVTSILIVLPVYLLNRAVYIGFEEDIGIISPVLFICTFYLVSAFHAYGKDSK